MKDFTLITYKKFLQELLTNGYSFQTLQDFIQHPNKEKIVILRHDVDRLPGNSLVIAKIEKEAGGRRPEVRCQKGKSKKQRAESNAGG